MGFIKSFIGGLCLALVVVPVAQAGDAVDGYRWIATTEEVLAEGILWNDGLGDGKDRYKSGGMTQSWVFPERVFSDEPWIANTASAIEVQGRGFIATPDNTAAGANPNDRPFAQYVGIGAYLRTFGRPDGITTQTTLSRESRIGIEIGYQGDPLPLFDIQDALHGMTGTGASGINRNNSINGQILVNLEGSHTWRFHADLAALDVQWAPFVQGATGMREVSARLGSDLIFGTSLEGRTWNHDPAIGALIPGGSMERDGVNWIGWLGADAGYVAHDAFLDGGFSGNSPGVARDPVTFRARAGVMLEYRSFALAYSVNWLSPEFKQQPEGQLIGAVALKYRF